MNKLQIIKQICDYHFTLDWTEKKRTEPLVFQRAVFYRVCKELTPHSLQQIGGMVEKDHATVLHGLKLFKNEIYNSRDIRDKFFPYYRLYKQVIGKCKKLLKPESVKGYDKLELFLHQNINLKQELEKKNEIIKKLLS